MSSAMEQLYQQVILDHSRDPHGRGLQPVADTAMVGESHQVNPTCGDEARLRLQLEAAPDGPRVRSVSWEGEGCSISQASLSVLHDLVSGADVQRVEELSEAFRALMHSRGQGLDTAEEDLLGDATAFTGVSRYPARIKCALLGWMALRDALAQALTAPATTSSEEDR